MGRQCLPSEVGVWLPSLRPVVEDRQQMLTSLAQLYVRGVKVDWSRLNQGSHYSKVSLPTYPFQRQRYWIETKGFDNDRKLLSRSKTLHPLLGQKLNLESHLAGLEKQYRFESQISVTDPAYLNDHQVFDQALFPTTAYLEIALAAGLNLFKSSNFVVEDLILQQGLILPKEEIKTVQTILTPTEKGTYQFQIFSQQEDQGEYTWKLHVQGKIRTVETVTAPPVVDLEQYLAECDRAITGVQHYQEFQQQGINYGISFQGIQQLWRGQEQAVGEIKLSSELLGQLGDYQLHPTMLDAALQVMGAAIGEINSDQTYLPVKVERLTVYRQPGSQVWAIASVSQLEANSTENLSAKVTLLNKDREVVAIVEGLRVKRATLQALLGEKSDSIKDWLYEIQWRSQARFGQGLPSDYLLTPEEVEQELTPTISELVPQEELASHGAMLTQLEELSVYYIVQAFKEMGWSYQPGEKFVTEVAAKRLRVVPSHRRLFHRLLQVMAESGILNYSDRQWQVQKSLEELASEPKIETILGQYPHNPAEIKLLNRCASQLSSVLLGAIDPVELVFPQGDLTTATQLYQDSPSAQAMNILVQKAIDTALTNLPSAQGVRLLEIGAGTGGTTSYILPKLNSEQSEYVFTDIGTLFLSKAQEKFQDYPFVRYQTLDIEVDPTTQGFESQQYDFIVAANVLHATASMSNTLSHVKQLLAPGGILVLLESTTRQRWLDLIFGLLDGWWKFDDEDLRPDYPLLSTSTWQQLLQEKGFDRVSILPKTEVTPAVLSQQAVILAQAESIPQPETITEPKSWLILADQQGVAQQLATQLRSQGDVCNLVFSGAKYAQIAQGNYTINPDHQEDFQRLIAQVTDTSAKLTGVVQCWSIEAGIDENITAEELEALSKLGCGTTLSLVQSLVKANLSSLPRLWLVTQGAQPVPANNPVIQGVVQSSLWGMGKVIALEHPELRCVRLDLDPNQTVEQQGKALWSEIWSENEEDQVALRNNSRYVARLVRSEETKKLEKQQKSQEPSQPLRLTTSGGGSLENLTLETTTRRSPQPGEVEIRIRATGLNFLDVVAALGLVPQQVDGVSQKHLLEMDCFGGECAGEIVAVGQGVTGFKVGDPVIALASGSFSEYVTVVATSVAPKPKQLSFEEAASIPVNFLTAYYALHHVAKISSGEKVLIHSGAGGTGMAAIQIAQLAGAEVFATASPPKWSALQAMGVKHIMNSRTLEFAETVRDITQGQGVDIVLNSLTSGDFIPKSLSVVNSQGRFVEIAKRGVWKSEQVAAVRPDIAYSVVDLVRKSQEQPELIQSMLQELVDKFEQGLLKSPTLKVFSIDDVVSAFRYMQRAKHIGKIVVNQAKPEADIQAQMPLNFSAENSYLITGGLGDLGLIVARWMVERGARYLVLLGRSKPSNFAQRQIEALEKEGANVIVQQADVCQYSSMAKVFNYINQSLPPLAGVIHSVGVLEDGVLQQQSWTRFAKVMNPKVQGAWNLHQLTKDQPLDFFVLFSSASSLWGSLGQSNYSAANAFLDGLAYYRQAQGLPGLSINWGPVSKLGEAAKKGADVWMQQRGIGAIEPSHILEALEPLMKSSAVEVGVVPIDWSLWPEGSRSKWPFWEDWTETTQTASESQPEFLEQLQTAVASEQRDLLVAHVRSQVAQVLGISDFKSISLDSGFFDLGMDSLTSVELRNCLQTSLGISISSTVAFDYPTVESLVDYLSEQLIEVEEPDTSATESSEVEFEYPEEESLVKTESLSEEQLEALINQKFDLLINEV